MLIWEVPTSGGEGGALIEKIIISSTVRWNTVVRWKTQHCSLCEFKHFYLEDVSSRVSPSVRHSVHGGGIPMWPLPMIHWTSLYRPPFPQPPPGYGKWEPLLVTSGGKHWRPLQTYSLEHPHQYWHLVAEARMVDKQVVRIPRECFLGSVLWYNYSL